MYAAGEAACVSINGANRLGSNSLGELLVFGARAGRAAAEYASHASAGIGEPVLAQAADEERRIESEYLSKTGGTRAHRDDSRGDAAHRWKRAPASTASAHRWPRRRHKIAELQERFKDHRLDDHSRTFNTQLIAALELGFMLDVAETIVHMRARIARNRAAPISARDFPKRDDKKFLAHSLVYRNAEGQPAVEYLPVTITRWPPGERVYGRRNQTDGGHDQSLEVARFRPRRDTEPHFESYEVPLRGDWMVLDALNYIKDQLDGSLTFRWSCRMGICGSCGMMVNGEPKLTCETLLSQLSRPARCASSRCAISR